MGDATGLKVAFGAEDKIHDAASDFAIIHHIPDWRSAVAEIARVLKPGGPFLFDEVTSPGPPYLPQALRPSGAQPVHRTRIPGRAAAPRPAGHERLYPHQRRLPARHRPKAGSEPGLSVLAAEHGTGTSTHIHRLSSENGSQQAARPGRQKIRLESAHWLHVNKPDKLVTLASEAVISI